MVFNFAVVCYIDSLDETVQERCEMAFEEIL